MVMPRSETRRADETTEARTDLGDSAPNSNDAFRLRRLLNRIQYTGVPHDGEQEMD